MVRLGLCAKVAASLVMVGSAEAQTVDWRRAGGDLFGATVAAAEAAGSGAQPPVTTAPFEALIVEAAETHGLDPKLLRALVLAESAYRADAVSPAGAAGLTQLMPSTAAELGVQDRFNPADNLNGGALYLARQIRRFGDLRLALAAFNSGPERVARLGRIPDIRETRDYVETVVECFLLLTAGQGPTDARQCRRTGATP